MGGHTPPRTRPPWTRPPWDQTPPQDQTPQEQTPPRSRHPHGSRHPPRSRHHPPRADTPHGSRPPQEQTTPGADTPPVNRMTNRCKNITLATTSLRPVNMKACTVNASKFKLTSAANCTTSTTTVITVLWAKPLYKRVDPCPNEYKLA